jgi:hypothetical protein
VCVEPNGIIKERVAAEHFQFDILHSITEDCVLTFLYMYIHQHSKSHAINKQQTYHTSFISTHINIVLDFTG